MDNQAMAVMMGLPEQVFLTAFHRALIWVGAGILVVGLAASYALVRSITIPLQKLRAVAEEIARANFGQKVEIAANDEVGRLALAFNRMSEGLAANNRLRQRLLADIAHELMLASKR